MRAEFAKPIQGQHEESVTLKYDYYDGVPGHVKGSDTSYDAAVSQITKAAIDRQKIVRLIAEKGKRGATCDECEEILGMLHQTCSARCTEAKSDGVIKDSGKRRKTRHKRPAAVLVLGENYGEIVYE